MNELKETGFQPPNTLEGDHPDGKQDGKQDVKQDVKQYIPFHAGFLGGNKVMNDGFTSNTLLLRLTNTLMPDPAYSAASKITFNGIDHPDTSRLILSVDTRLEDDRRAWLPDKEKYDNGFFKSDNQDEWCLGTENHVKFIDVTVSMQNDQGDLVKDPNWTVTPPVVGQEPQWIIKSKRETSIDPGEHITVVLTGIVTALPAGIAHLYLHYENIPGYLDGQLVCPITKTPFVIQKGKVGLGTSTPHAKLSVIGSVRGAHSRGETEYTEIGHGGTNGYVNTKGYGNLDFRHNDMTKMSLTPAGKVGIGTQTPQQNLHIAKGYSNQSGIRIEDAGNYWDVTVQTAPIDSKDGTKNQELMLKYNGDSDSQQWASIWFEPGGGIRQYCDIKSIENIRHIDDALSKVLQLNPISFTWKNTANNNNKRRLGFSAQDVEKILPDLVNQKKEGKTLSYNDFIVLAIAAIQELQKRVEKLENKD